MKAAQRTKILQDGSRWWSSCRWMERLRVGFVRGGFPVPEGQWTSQLQRGAGRWARRFGVYLAACLPVLLWPAMSLRALDPYKQIGQYGHDSWTSQRGLPGEAVYQILQSRDGYLWLRTGRGLARFDGVRFVQMDSVMGHEVVQAIAMSASGDLLIRGASRTMIYRDSTFSDYLPASPLPDGGIRVLFESREHTAFLGADDFIYRLDPGGPSMLRRGTAYINAFLEDDSGRIWIGGDHSLLTYQDGKLAAPVEIAANGPGVTALLEDHRHRIWAGTWSGMVQLSGERLEGRSGVAADGQGVLRVGSPRSVTALLEDRQGNIWVGTQYAGVVRLGDGPEASMNAVSGLTDSNVLSLFEDREGSVWIGTTSGLDRLRDTRMTTFGVREGLPANYAKSILANSDGSVYVFTQTDGLSLIRNGVATRVEFNGELPSSYSDALFRSRDGSVWMNTDRGLSQYKDGKFTVYPGKLEAPPGDAATRAKDEATHFAGKHVAAIAEDEESLIVTTSECAAWRFKDGRTYPFTLRGRQTPFTTPQGIYTFTVYVAPSKTLWFGTTNGLYKLVPGGPMPAGPQPEAAFAVTSIYDDGQGHLWLSGRTPGFVRFNIADGHATHFTAAQGLFDGSVSHILPDDVGNLWVSTHDGIYQVPKQELEDVAAGLSTRVSAHLYGLADGLKTTQAADPTSQPSGARGADGSLWFATYKGVVTFDPSHLMQNGRVAPVVLETVVADGTVLPTASDYEIKAGTKSLEFQYTALSMRVPERVRFRYKLEGYDPGWIEAGARRVAYYTNLSPGRYRFLVIASNDDGLWNEQGASARLHLNPLFYQTWWFEAICILLIPVAGFAAHHRNTQRMRANARELSRLVEERTSELRESQNELRQLALFDTLTSLPNRRMFTQDFSNMQAMMKGSGFSLLLIDFDRFKHINDTYGHDAGDAFLVEASVRLRAAVRSSDRVARLGGDEFAILLAGDHDESTVHNTCDRIVRSFGDAIDFRGANITTSASVGVAMFPVDGATQEELYRSADTALYEAKRRGRDKWIRYSTRMVSQTISGGRAGGGKRSAGQSSAARAVKTRS